MPLARLIASVVVLTLIAGSVSAKPIHKHALADHFGPFLARKLHDCRTCHVPDKPNQTAEDEKPHNLFGLRMVAVKGELRKKGQPIAIADRIQAIADEDSDADGVPNLVELLIGHNPGDAKDTPRPEAVAEYPAKLAAFRKFQAAYAWRPFEPVKRPDVPAVQNTNWLRNPIDAFIAAEHEERGLRPRTEASKVILLRRVYLDLIGLPPTPDEQHAFLRDTSETAYEKVVDRLLASPRYGERWGRHWMDVWRYSDWAGWDQQVRDSQPHIWRWRDWIVESLNADTSYDRMIREMLAGDELAPSDPKTLRATGYLVRNFKLLSREKWMQDTVDHTFQAFLGVTIGCARCHDHMYDPIDQKEYYQVRAVFEPHQVRIDRIPGVADPKADGLPRAYDADAKVATYFFHRGDDRTPDKSAVVPPGIPSRLGGPFPEVKPVGLSLTARFPDRRPFVIQETLAESERKIRQAENAIVAARRNVIAAHFLPLANPRLISTVVAIQRSRDAVSLTELDAIAARERHTALSAVVKVEQIEAARGMNSPGWKTAAEAAVVAQRKLAITETRRALFAAERGLAPPTPKDKKPPSLDALRKSVATAEADAAKPITTAYTNRSLPAYPPESTGRRSALAKWMTDPGNPLAARVAMNHIWLRHFGRGIVPSVADFGRNGQRPSHPALLDWLAAEFVARGWSMKAMHRLIVTSATYRQASTPDDSNLAADRDNTYLWRMPSRRLEAEIVRDQVFYVAGKLDLTMGGPDIDHNQGLSVPRRSLYFRHAAEKQMEFLKIFDTADVNECYLRKESVIPQQALALANSELTIRHARLLARDLHARSPSATEFVLAAYESVLARPPTADESAECIAFLKPEEATSSAASSPDSTGKRPSTDPVLRARENLVHVLLNHHDFVTIR